MNIPIYAEYGNASIYYRNEVIMFKSGQIVSQSGIYKCTNCHNEVTCVKGERFPPCCASAGFVLVRATR